MDLPILNLSSMFNMPIISFVMLVATVHVKHFEEEKFCSLYHKIFTLLTCVEQGITNAKFSAHHTFSLCNHKTFLSQSLSHIQR